MFRSRSCCYRERKREGGTKVPTLSFLGTGSGTWSSGTCQVPRASTHFSHMVELYTALQNQKEQTYFIGYFILTTGHHLTPDTTTQYARMRVSHSPCNIVPHLEQLSGRVAAFGARNAGAAASAAASASASAAASAAARRRPPAGATTAHSSTTSVSRRRRCAQLDY